MRFKDENFLILKIVVLAIIVAFSSCRKSIGENMQTESRPSPTVVQFTNINPTLFPELDSGIRKIDFGNFTFPWTEDQGASDSFTLIEGKKERVGDESGAHLQPIEYGDVTNDKQEEAMISISPETGGNCQCFMVYVYTLKNNKPTLLWSFDTWDRAEGGFKRAYSERGDLVIELFGDDKFENDKWDFDIAEGKFNGLCCPTTYTRFHFHWNGSKFVLTGKPELFNYDWRKHPDGKG